MRWLDWRHDQSLRWRRHFAASHNTARYSCNRTDLQEELLKLHGSCELTLPCRLERPARWKCGATVGSHAWGKICRQQSMQETKLVLQFLHSKRSINAVSIPGHVKHHVHHRIPQAKSERRTGRRETQYLKINPGSPTSPNTAVYGACSSFP